MTGHPLRIAYQLLLTGLCLANYFKICSKLIIHLCTQQSWRFIFRGKLIYISFNLRSGYNILKTI